MNDKNLVQVGVFKGTPGLRCAYCRGDNPDVVFRKEGQHFFFHKVCLNTTLCLSEVVLPVYEVAYEPERSS
jgi:hypothetical protein